MPEYVDGITNLRGKVITVLNLRKRFGFAIDGIGTDEKIILIQGSNIGFRVDSVEEIAVPKEGEIIEPDDFQHDLNESFIWKLMKRNNGVTIILEPHDIIKHSHLDTHLVNLAEKLEKIPMI